MTISFLVVQHKDGKFETCRHEKVGDVAVHIAECTSIVNGFGPND